MSWYKVPSASRVAGSGPLPAPVPELDKVVVY